MDEQNDNQEKTQSKFFTRNKLLFNAFAICDTAIGFLVIAIWLPLKGPFFDVPLRSLLTGLALLGLACPLFTAGFYYQRKAEMSPYFEEGFIRTGFYIFGFVCSIIGILCIGLSVYALIMRAIGEG